MLVLVRIGFIFVGLLVSMGFVLHETSEKWDSFADLVADVWFG